jgi:hypothetical protein
MGRLWGLGFATEITRRFPPCWAGDPPSNVFQSRQDFGFWILDFGFKVQNPTYDCPYPYPPALFTWIVFQVTMYNR